MAIVTDPVLGEPKAQTPVAPNGRDASVVIKNLTVSYRRRGRANPPVLQNMSFTVPSGSFATVVGSSGSGKSTLLKVIGGLHTPDSGEVLVGGEPLTTPRPDMITTVFQDSCLMPWRTVVRNIELPLEVRGVGREERRARAHDMLALVGLADYAQRFPRELSGGMRQRVAIARALVVEPPVLLMDEPFSALDEQTRYEMGEELLRLWDRLKATVVFVTHSLSEAIFLADKVIVLEGRPVSVGRRVRVDFERPRDLALMTRPEFQEIRADLTASLRRPASVSETAGS
jgi:NitT/TauT family transport system ATP-binding protein